MQSQKIIKLKLMETPKKERIYGQIICAQED
jgi:hypothetical protein